MKSSLAFVLVLVLILGIIIPSGVSAAAVPESALQESIVKLLETIKSVFGIDISTMEHYLSHLEDILLHLKKHISHVELHLDHYKTLINEITEALKKMMA